MTENMCPMKSTEKIDENGGQYSRTKNGEKADHQFVPYNAKRPGSCAYCKSVLIGFVNPTVRCKVCRQIVHLRCKMNVPYCSGAPAEQHPLSKVLGTRSKSIESRNSKVDDKDDSHKDLDIATTMSSPKARRRHKGGCAGGRTMFADDSCTLPSSLIPSPPQIPGEPALRKKPEQCVILYDYNANSTDDLSIKAGQKVTLINSTCADWWEGSYKEKVGFFPASYALKFRFNDVILKSLYDFDGEEDGMLSIAEGQILILIKDEGNGWMIVRGVDGEGEVPSSYMQRYTPQ